MAEHGSSSEMLMPHNEDYSKESKNSEKSESDSNADKETKNKKNKTKTSKKEVSFGSKDKVETEINPEEIKQWEIKLAKTINQGVIDVEKSLTNPDLKFSQSERGFLEWVKKAIPKCDDPRNMSLEYIREASLSPVEMLINALDLIDEESAKTSKKFNHRETIEFIKRNSVDYFQRFFGKKHGKGLTTNEGDRQNPHTEREAYFIHLPENIGYRNFLIHRYSNDIEGFEGMSFDKQNYQLAMKSYGDRRIVKLIDHLPEEDFGRDIINEKPFDVDKIEEAEREFVKKAKKERTKEDKDLETDSDKTEPSSEPKKKETRETEEDNVIPEEYKKQEGDLSFDYDEEDEEDEESKVENRKYEWDYDEFDDTFKISTPEIKKYEELLAERLVEIRDKTIEYQPLYEQASMATDFNDFDAESWASDIRMAFLKAGIDQNSEDMNLLITLAAFETCFRESTTPDILKNRVHDNLKGIVSWVKKFALFKGLDKEAITNKVLTESKTVGPTQISYELVAKLHKDKFGVAITDEQAKRIAGSLAGQRIIGGSDNSDEAEKPLKNIDNALMYSLLYLQELKKPYEDVLNPEEKAAFIFADWNAGEFRCRNAGFQKVLAELSGQDLGLDGVLGPASKAAAKNLIEEKLGASKMDEDRFEKDWSLANTAEFSETNLWKFIEILKAGRIEPIVADAKVLDPVSKLVSKTTSSKEFSDKATNIYNKVVNPAVEEYFQEYKKEHYEYPKTVDAAVLELKQELNIHPEVEIVKEKGLINQDRIDAVMNLLELLSQIEAYQLQRWFAGLDKLVIDNRDNSKIADYGHTIHIGSFKKEGKPKRWETIPANDDALQYLIEGLQKAWQEREDAAQELETLEGEFEDVKEEKVKDKFNPAFSGLKDLLEKDDNKSKAKNDIEEEELIEKPKRKRNKKKSKDVPLVENFETNLPAEESELTAEEMMKIVEIHGDDPEVTPELLKKLSIIPEFLIYEENRKVSISKCFDMKDGYIAAMAFVEDDGKLVARSYYKSRTGGAVWRYLPSYSGKHIGKGYSNKNSVIAPSFMQYALAEVSKEDHLENITKTQAEKIFYGTAKYKTEAAPDEMIPGDEGRFTYYGSKGVDKNAFRIPGEIGAEQGVYSNQLSPEKIEISNEEIRPDFSKIGTDGYFWTQKIEDPITNRNYEIDVDIVPSKDLNINYMFCWDHEKERAWIGMVEMANSEISATGLREKWVDAGRLVTPVIDYADHDIEGYGDPIPGKPEFVDMFPRYVSQIEEIKKYISVKKAIKALNKTK